MQCMLVLVHVLVCELEQIGYGVCELSCIVCACTVCILMCEPTEITEGMV